MKIGIDCDGVLRDLISKIRDKIIEIHPHFKKQIQPTTSWGWEGWLPFWSHKRTEDFIFKEHYLDIFENANAYNDSIIDWPVLCNWAKENEHQLILVSSQRQNCIEPTNKWLQKQGFSFDNVYYIKEKWLVDVDILIDDSPYKLKSFREKSITKGVAVCMNRSWNSSVSNNYYHINRINQIIGIIKEIEP